MLVKFPFQEQTYINIGQIETVSKIYCEEHKRPETIIGMKSGVSLMIAEYSVEDVISWLQINGEEIRK